jgi:hypothetical protein
MLFILLNGLEDILPAVFSACLHHIFFALFAIFHWQKEAGRVSLHNLKLDKF